MVFVGLLSRFEMRQGSFQKSDFDRLLADETFQFGDFGFVLVGMTVACKGFLAIASQLAFPLPDAIGMHLMFARGLGDRFACFDLAQHLLLKFFGKLPTFETL